MPKVLLELPSFSRSGKTRVSGKRSAGTASPVIAKVHGLKKC